MRPRPCLSAESVAELVRGNGTEEDQLHSIECATCARRVSLLRRIHSAGPGPVAGAVDEVEVVVARLLATPRRNWWRAVKELEYRRPEVVRRLLRLGVDARLRDLGLAVDLAKAATAIGELLANRVPDVADLRFETWKFSSAVLREAGRYAETEAALARANEAAQATSDPELSQASVLLARALLCAEPDIWRPHDAAALLDQAEIAFSRRDPGRMLGLLTARGFLLFRAGAMAAARDIFKVVLEQTPESDREGYLNALNNFVAPRVELRDSAADVERAISLLVEENVALGRGAQVARARWLMGRVHLIRGDFDAAVYPFRTAMATIGDSDSSIRFGLDTIEALLLGSRHHEAFELARELATAAVALEQREPSRRHGLTAQVFAYLREAAQRQVLTADLVADVARYLDRITRQRPVAFVPPMPLVDM